MSVRGLTVSYGDRAVLDAVDVDLLAGRVQVVLGPSGSGKTTLLRALIGMVPVTAEVTAHRFTLRAGGREIDLSVPRSRAWRGVRGRHVGLVSQDPAQSLTALRRAGSLVRETLGLAGAATDRSAVATVLRGSGFAEPDAVAARYCFELSGGMAQRLGVGLALAPRPVALLADEPSTALDGIARAALAASLRATADGGVAILLVTHDVTFAEEIADDLVVLDDGRVAEAGSAAEVLDAPRQASTRHLIDAGRPEPAGATVTRDRAGPTAPSVALAVRGLRKRYRGTGQVLAGVDITVTDGEVVGIAGRSGAGKTTLLRCLVGLDRPDDGELRIGGATPAEAGWRALRRRVQVVPQDPRASLNPWRTARHLVADPLDIHRIGTRAERHARADALLDRVGLAGFEQRRPGELSTGQCQRVAIARALALSPRLLVADEPVTALDAPLRRDVLALLRELVRENDMAALVVSHDLYVLEALCHRVVVLDAGRIVEELPVGSLRGSATHPLTRAFVDCHPRRDTI
jgi:peptide/nickel transport system ATP-binding protein